jgi:hypothetical protein
MEIYRVGACHVKERCVIALGSKEVGVAGGLRDTARRQLSLCFLNETGDGLATCK